MPKTLTLDLSTSLTGYADHMRKLMKLLEKATLPNPIIWKIDWQDLEQISSHSSNRKNWKAVNIFKKRQEITSKIPVFIISKLIKKMQIVSLTRSGKHMLFLRN